MRLSEQFKFVPVGASIDISGGITGDSINMEGYHSCTFVIMGTTTNWTASPDIIVYEAASDGGTTAAVTFTYRQADAAIGSASCDVLGAAATSAELDLGADNEGVMTIIEIQANEMTDGYNWLTLSVDADASAGGMTILAILEPRYPQNIIATALT